MKIIKVSSGLTIVFLLITACFPILRTQAVYDVEVTWLISGSSRRDHEVTFQGQNFVIPPGKEIRLVHRLKGGSRDALLYSVRGWGFQGQAFAVDGEELPLTQIHRGKDQGEWRVLGFGRKPAMVAEIKL